ncbi:MAG: hypothetical protein Q7T03_03970 [Deltaproteobacteria bacterium]|nr:hypothetical protein [Deltaproteobacteria bacterium]
MVKPVVAVCRPDPAALMCVEEEPKKRGTLFSSDHFVSDAEFVSAPRRVIQRGSGFNLLVGCSPYYGDDLCTDSFNPANPTETIDLSSLESVSPEAAQRFRKILSTLPARFLAGVKTITVVDNFETTPGVQGYGTREEHAGAKKKWGGVLDVRRGDLEATQPEQIYWLREAVIHEIGHIVAERLSVEKRHEWKQIHQSDVNAESVISTYSGTGAVEDFAEFFAKMIVEPDLILQGAVQNETLRKKYDFFIANVFCNEEPIPKGLEFFKFLTSSAVIPSPGVTDDPAYAHLKADIFYEMAKNSEKYFMRVEMVMEQMAKATEGASAFQTLPDQDYIHASDHGLYSRIFEPTKDFLGLLKEQIQNDRIAGSVAIFVKNFVDRLERKDSDLPWLGWEEIKEKVLGTVLFYVSNTGLWPGDTNRIAEQVARLWNNFDEESKKNYLISNRGHLFVGLAFKEPFADIFLADMLTVLAGLDASSDDAADLQMAIYFLASGAATEEIAAKNTIKTAKYLKIAADHFQIFNSDSLTDPLLSFSDLLIWQFQHTGILPEADLLTALDSYLAKVDDATNACGHPRLLLAASLLHSEVEGPASSKVQEYFSRFQAKTNLRDYLILPNDCVKYSKESMLNILLAYFNALGDVRTTPLQPWDTYLPYYFAGELMAKGALQDFDLLESHTERQIQIDGLRSYIKAHEAYYTFYASNREGRPDQIYPFEITYSLTEQARKFLDFYLTQRPVFVDETWRPILTEFRDSFNRSLALDHHSRPEDASHFYYYSGILSMNLDETDQACSTFLNGILIYATCTRCNDSVDKLRDAYHNFCIRLGYPPLE